MKDIRDGGPAFPFGQTDSMSGQLVNGWGSQGMTLRDYFAAKALHGVLSGYSGTVGVGMDEANSGISACAYAIADAMPKEREK